MKKKELVKVLNSKGFKLIRSNKHDIFSNGNKSVAIPQHKEVNRMLTMRILKEIA